MGQPAQVWHMRRHARMPSLFLDPKSSHVLVMGQRIDQKDFLGIVRNRSLKIAYDSSGTRWSLHSMSPSISKCFRHCLFCSTLVCWGCQQSKARWCRPPETGLEGQTSGGFDGHWHAQTAQVLLLWNTAFPDQKLEMFEKGQSSWAFREPWVPWRDPGLMEITWNSNPPFLLWHYDVIGAAGNQGIPRCSRSCLGCLRLVFTTLGLLTSGASSHWEMGWNGSSVLCQVGVRHALGRQCALVETSNISSNHFHSKFPMSWNEVNWAIDGPLGPLAIELNQVLWEAVIVTLKKMQEMDENGWTWFKQMQDFPKLRIFLVASTVVASTAMIVRIGVRNCSKMA